MLLEEIQTHLETIYGTRWATFPDHPCLIADVSSEFMARPMDVRRFALLFGGTQKNLGIAGVVLAIVRRDLYERIPATVPPIFNFQVHAKTKSSLNTPPTFGIYVLLETLRWLVIVVVLYAAAVMFRSSMLGRRQHRPLNATAAVLD